MAIVESFLRWGTPIIGCLAVLLAGCSRKAMPTGRTITSFHMPGVYEEAARRLATEFEQQTGIHVRIVSANFFSLREKSLTDLLTGGGNYDVFQVAYQWEGEILPHLRPLDDVVAQIAPDFHDFIPTVRSNCGQWNGRIYGLPIACDVTTLLYRTDVFEARSAEFQQLTGRPLRPPQTWPEYVEIAKFLNSESLYGNILMGQEQTYTLWSGILHGLGGRLVDAHLRPVLNSDAGEESLTLFVEMYRYAPPRSEARGVREADGLFLQGRGAMYLAWPSLIWSQLTDTNRCKIAGRIGAAVIPGGQPQLSSWSLGVNPACRDLDAAYQWIKFFVNQTNTKRLLLDYGIGSPRLSTYSDPECQQKVFYLTPLREGFAGTQTRLRISPSQELSDYLDNELIKAIRGQSTPRAALDRTAARWREILTQSGYLREPAPL
ncbi:MAG: sugar ABC transporter substrate-binding protein [Verrucomicrobiae bacterium]|nr:sugar ABC transporter substrate-binding protein [Verrucomicrobiae bacterium]